MLPVEVEEAQSTVPHLHTFVVAEVASMLLHITVSVKLHTQGKVGEHFVPEVGVFRMTSEL